MSPTEINQTTVMTGLTLGGAVNGVLWWALGAYNVLPVAPPPEIIAMSAVLVTALLQAVVPAKR